jgi:plastocyanin
VLAVTRFGALSDGNRKILFVTPHRAKHLREFTAGAFLVNASRMKYPLLAGGVFVLILVSGCGSSNPMTNPSPTPGPITSGSTVSIVSGATTRTTNAYSPNPINVSAGATVTWTNNDTVAHTSTSDTGVWSSGSIAPQASFSRQFSTAGTFTYHCAFHPGMVGTVTVQ